MATQKQIKEARRKAYDLLSKNWCSGSLIRAHRRGFNGPVESYSMCLEGAILVACGFDQESLFNYTKVSPTGTLGGLLYELEQNADHADAQRLVPDTFDPELAEAVQATLIDELKAEERFRNLVESYGWDREGHNPYLYGINDDYEVYGQPVVLELLRDGLWEADPDVKAEADELLAVENALDKEYLDA